jgi:hypothetical protein
MNPPSQEASVRNFLSTARRHRSALADGLRWSDGPEVWRRLVERAAGGWIPRRGVAGSISYLVHGGSGCRLCLNDETLCVDGDVLPSGELSFDIWRIRRFADSSGIPARSPDVLAKECDKLVRERKLRALRENWYAVLL